MALFLLQLTGIKSREGEVASQYKNLDKLGCLGHSTSCATLPTYRSFDFTGNVFNIFFLEIEHVVM